MSNTTTKPVVPSQGPGALPHEASLALFVALFFTLLVARGLGELARKLHQPMVLGELIGGILLGKTCLYHIWPEAWTYMYGPDRKSTTGFAGITALCASMFMLISGLELNLSLAKKNFKASMSVGLWSIIIPFVMGFSITYTHPEAMGAPLTSLSDPLPYALFVGVALAITALPVVAKTLRDLGLYTSQMGVVVMSAAAIDDLLGWSIFALVLVINNKAPGDLGVAGGIIVSIVYVVSTVTLGNLMVNRALPVIQAKFSWPGGTLGFVVSYALASSAFALWIGLHNTLGSFIVGIAVGNSPRFRSTTREILDQVVVFVMAPLFFGSLCLNVDLAAFNPSVVFLVFFIACVGKLIGAYIGARPFLDHVQSSAIAVAMNSRGAMELLIAQVAMDSGVIDTTMFVALVFVAIVTSLIPGPLLRYVLDKKDPVTFRSFIPQHGFTRDDTPFVTRDMFIRQMLVGVLMESIEEQVIHQVNEKPQGCNHGFATPVARIPTVNRPVILVGIYTRGLHFDAPNQRLSTIIFLLLLPTGKTPKLKAKYDALERELLEEIIHLYSTSIALRVETCDASDRTEFVALVRIYKHVIAQESFAHEQEMLRESELQARRDSNFAHRVSISSPRRAMSLSGTSRLLRMMSGAPYLDGEETYNESEPSVAADMGGGGIQSTPRLSTLPTLAEVDVPDSSLNKSDHDVSAMGGHDDNSKEVAIV